MYDPVESDPVVCIKSDLLVFYDYVYLLEKLSIRCGHGIGRFDRYNDFVVKMRGKWLW